MKYSFVFLLSLAPLFKKCAIEGAEQGAKRGGREVVEEGSEALLRNSGEILTRASVKSTRYFSQELNEENENVNYVESTNTFVISNE